MKFVVTLMLTVSAINVKAEKIAKVCTLDSYPPFTFAIKGKDPNKTNELIKPGKDSKILQGFAWDVVKNSFHDQGYTVDLKIAPWARCMDLVKKGEIHAIFPASQNDERKKEFFFSSNYVDETGYVVYTNKKTPVSWKGLPSLDGKVIHVMRGWSYGKDFEKYNGFQKKNVLNDSIVGALKMLKHNRIEYLIGYDIAFDYEIKKLQMNSHLVKSPSFGTAREYLMGQKNTKDIKKILKVFDTGRKAIESKGIYKSIQAKWN